MNLIDSIREITKQNILTTIRCEVKSVDETKGTVNCQPLNSDDPEILDVKINANLNPVKGLRFIPSIGSIVYVTFENESDSEGFISLYSEVDKMLIDSNEIIFNGGQNEGLINIIDLVSKLNTLENDINNLKSSFSSWVPVPNDGGAALKTSASSWFGSTLTNTNKSDIEDTKIKH